MIFFNPLSFGEQKEIFEKLKSLINSEIGLIVVDSISMLYRLELGRNDEVSEVNSALGKQIGYLVEISRRHKIPILITTQVYADFDNRSKVKMVGGDLLKYGRKCLLELQKSDFGRCILLKKHRSLPETTEAFFKIINSGAEEEKHI